MRLSGSASFLLTFIQAAFRKNRNCRDPILALTNFIELRFEKCLYDGCCISALVCSVSYIETRIVNQAERNKKCRKTLTLIINLLIDRYIQVEINDKRSSKRTLKYGLPYRSNQSIKVVIDIAIIYQVKLFEDIEKGRNFENCRFIR